MNATSQPKSTPLRLNLLFSLLQSFFWGAHCVYFSFLVLYLNTNGYSNATIGFLMVILAFIGVFVPPIAGYLADFFIPVKKIVSGCLLLSIPAAFLLPATVGVVPLAFVSVACMSVLEKNLSSVIDSWEMRVQHQNPRLNYGLTRGLASLSYACAGLIFGNVFSAVGLDALFFVHAFFAGIALLAAMFLDAVPIQPRKLQAGVQPVKTSYLQVLRGLLQNKRYRILVVSLACYGMSTVAIHTFQPLLLAQMGGTSAELGVCLFVMAASEVPMMFLFQRLVRKFRCDKLLCLSFFSTVVRLVCGALAPTIPLLIATQLIHSLSFGLYLPCVLRYISAITPGKVKATAITFAMACADGLAGVVGNAMGGAASEVLGVRTVILGLAGIACVGFLVFCLSFRVPYPAETEQPLQKPHPS